MGHPFKTEIQDARAFVPDLYKKNMKFQLLRGRQPQNALLNFLEKSTFSMLPKCKIALSCRREADFHTTRVLQTIAFFFLRFFLICVAPARDAHFSGREPPKWLQNDKKLVPGKTIRFFPPRGPSIGPHKDPKMTPRTAGWGG